MLKEYKTILLDEVDSVAILKLNRPEKLNAFNMQMFDDMLDAIDLVNNNDNIKSLVITGSGRAFCAGADLSFGEKTFDKEFDTKGQFEADYRRDAGGILNLKIYNSLKPVIAACNGDAVGVGATMQLPADVRIATTNSRFANLELVVAILTSAGNCIVAPTPTASPLHAAITGFKEL